MVNLEFDFSAPSPRGAPTELALKAYFNDWLASTSHGKLRSGSERLYKDMWKLFTEFCLAMQLWPEDVSVGQLQGHLDDRHGLASGKDNPNKELTPRYAWRLLRLIDRVLTSRMEDPEQQPPTAAATLLASEDDYRFANAGEDDLPTYLPAGDARRLVIYLSDARPRPGRAIAGITWKALRNRAAVGLQLGAGLTPGEVRALTVDDPVVKRGGGDTPWKIRVPSDGTTPEREAPLAAWAGKLLQRWIEVRLQQKIPGPVLFPSTRAGAEWGKESQYKTFRQVMEDAELEIGPGGSFQLRHTFALRQLHRRKTDPAVVAGWLGIKDMTVMRRYERVLIEPADVI